MTTSPKIRGAILGRDIRREQGRGDTLPPPYASLLASAFPPPRQGGPWGSGANPDSLTGWHPGIVSLT